MPDFGPRWTLEEGYRIELFAEQDQITEQDVLDLWDQEGVVIPAEAQRRISEVAFIATHETAGLAGVSSAYLEHNAQLRMDLWYYRAFVASGHRKSVAATNLALRGREHFKELFVSGEDTRGAGMIFEVENEGLKRYFNEARWWPTDFLFIGENARGDHVRVHYFPGSLAPDPPR